MSTPLLCKAIKEEAERRKASANEINELKNLVNSLIVTLSERELRTRVNNMLESDITNIKILMKSLEENSNIYQYKLHPALKTNKLELLFQGAKEFIDKHFFQEGFDFTIDRNSPADFNGTYDLHRTTYSFGTSALNYAQVALLTVLRILKNGQNLQDLFKSCGNIYNVSKSPTVHTTMLPEKYKIEEAAPELKDWFYIYKDQESPIQCELLTPTLGYAFGGSRVDKRYNNKLFSAEDCSSSLAKWLGATLPFTTIDMKIAYEGDIKENSYAEEVLKYLKPIKKEDANVGSVFVVRTQTGGHTGIITDVCGNDKFNTLSFSRDMPNIDGLGYRQIDINQDSTKTWYFFHQIDSACSAKEAVKCVA